MVRLDAFGSQVGLLVVIMRGAYLLESTVVYNIHARDFWEKQHQFRGYRQQERIKNTILLSSLQR